MYINTVDHSSSYTANPGHVFIKMQLLLPKTSVYKIIQNVMNWVSNARKTVWIQKYTVSKEDSYTEQFTILEDNKDAHCPGMDARKINQS